MANRHKIDPESTPNRHKIGKNQQKSVPGGSQRPPGTSRGPLVDFRSTFNVFLYRFGKQNAPKVFQKRSRKSVVFWRRLLKRPFYRFFSVWDPKINKNSQKLLQKRSRERERRFFQKRRFVLKIIVYLKGGEIEKSRKKLLQKNTFLTLIKACAKLDVKKHIFFSIWGSFWNTKTLKNR